MRCDATAGRHYLIQEDLQHFLEPQDAAEAFQLLDQDGNGRVTLKEMRMTVLSIYKVRSHLSRPAYGHGLTSWVDAGVEETSDPQSRCYGVCTCSSVTLCQLLSMVAQPFSLALPHGTRRQCNAGRS